MTFQVTVHDSAGAGIAGLLVTANNEITGESFSRSTDGSGYADVAMLGHTAVGHRVTLSVLDPLMRYTGLVLGDALVITAADQLMTLVLQPFKRPHAVDIARWCGAFCIPDAFTAIPYGDGRRIWTPALLCYDDIDRDRIYTALAARGYTHVPILLSGRPYGDMYPTIPFSAPFASFIIHEMQARGFVPVLAFDDARGPDCSYLQPLADLTQTGPLVIMGPYEINDGNRPDADLRSILVQKFALWPNAVQAVHFTPGHGSGGGPTEWEWWQWAHDVCGIRIHLAQEAWFDDPRMSGIGMQDNARRLVGDVGGAVPPAWSNMQSRPIATVRFEQTTSRTLHGQMTEAQAIAFDHVAKQYCPHTIGFCDGGTP